jgi:hypothetical protein
VSKLYTIPQLARSLGVGYKVVYSLRSRGLLTPFQHNGSREYFRMEDYERAALFSREQAAKTHNPAQRQTRPIHASKDFQSIFRQFFEQV